MAELAKFLHQTLAKVTRSKQKTFAESLDGVDPFSWIKLDEGQKYRAPLFKKSVAQKTASKT